MLELALLIIIVCMIGIILLIVSVKTQIYEVGTDMLRTMMSVMEVVNDDGNLTRRRIAEVKTRMADEERDDQKAKAKARKGKK